VTAVFAHRQTVYTLVLPTGAEQETYGDGYLAVPVL